MKKKRQKAQVLKYTSSLRILTRQVGIYFLPNTLLGKIGINFYLERNLLVTSNVLSELVQILAKCVIFLHELLHNIISKMHVA